MAAKKKSNSKNSSKRKNSSKAKRGDVFVEGIDVVIRRDLDKHKELLNRDNMNIQSLESARTQEIGRRKFYISQIGQKKYRKKDMDAAIKDMRINIQHYSDKIKISKELRAQNTLIVDTLTKQLDQYYKDLVRFKS